MKRPWRPDPIVIRDYLDVLARPDAAFTMRKLETAVGQTGKYHRNYLLHLKQRGWISIRSDEDGKVPVRITLDGRRSLEQIVRFCQAFYGHGLFADMPPPGTYGHQLTDNTPDVEDEELLRDS